VQVLLVTVKMKPEHRPAFIKAMLEDARGSVTNEPGCLRFDVLQDEEDLNTLHLYEVYRDKAALEAHRQAPHYTRWRETVRDWFAEPAARRSCTNVFPQDSAWKK
jgi:quinol monooxygenase YgiN